MPTEPNPGDRVMCRTALDTWVEKVACSGIERGHKFAVVFVTDDWARDKRGYGWPAEDVVLASEHKTDG